VARAALTYALALAALAVWVYSNVGPYPTGAP